MFKLRLCRAADRAKMSVAYGKEAAEYYQVAYFCLTACMDWLTGFMEGLKDNASAE